MTIEERINNMLPDGYCVVRQGIDRTKDCKRVASCAYCDAPAGEFHRAGCPKIGTPIPKGTHQ